MKKQALLALLVVPALGAGVIGLTQTAKRVNIEAAPVLRTVTLSKDNESVETADGNTVSFGRHYSGTESDVGLCNLKQNGVSIDADYKFNHVESIVIEFNDFTAEGGYISVTLSKTTDFVRGDDDVNITKTTELYKDYVDGDTEEFDFSGLEQDGDYRIQIWATLWTRGEPRNIYDTKIKSITVSYTC